MTNQEILVNVTPQETRVAILRKGITQEIHLQRDSNIGMVGNIYLGKVVRVLPGIQSAFIDIGFERAAFIHVADISGTRQLSEENIPQKPIEETLRDGQELLVQVIKEPIGSKGARLSTQISIAGRLVVYLPHDPYIGISQRIEDEAEREQLRQTLQQVLDPHEVGGFIVRTAAETAAETEFAADIQYLKKIWNGICELKPQTAAPGLLYQDLNLSLRVLRDLATAEINRILIDDEKVFHQAQQFAEAYMPDVKNRLVHYSDTQPIFEMFDVEKQIEQALSRRVDLKSGGYLIFDQTEALTTIDVNTGGYVGGRNFHETMFKTNLEAAQAIGRQLRLRNLGGMILVDFIDMEVEEHKQAVQDEMNKVLAEDRTKITVHGFTALGLVEITRKRTRESLAHLLCEPCLVCEGRGEIKTAQTVCYEILRDLLREARQFNVKARGFRILAHPKVVDLFLDEEASALANLSDLIGKPISLQPEGQYLPERYDIVFL